MRAIDFRKVHGLGNDFVLVDAIDDSGLMSLDWPGLAKRWCDRHAGIGADGLLLVSRAERGADATMRIFNADGSEAQMCGNGIRCVARHLVSNRGIRDPVLRLETSRGVMPITWADAGGVFSATVNMGEPVLDPARIPVRAARSPCVDHVLQLDALSSGNGGERLDRSLGMAAHRDGNALAIRLTAVSMGNPHAVIRVERVADLPIGELGPAIEMHPDFPERTNVQFLQVNTTTSATLRTWERGAGPTLACGTGACAALVAGVLAGRLAREATIHLQRGDLRIRWDEASNHVFMTGPAVEIYRGQIMIAARE